MLKYNLKGQVKIELQGTYGNRNWKDTLQSCFTQKEIQRKSKESLKLKCEGSLKLDY